MGEEKNKSENKNKIKKILIIISIIIICLLFSVIFAIIAMMNNKIINGVKIENINVSGYTRDKLEEKLNGLENENKTKKIILKYQDTELDVTPEDFEINYNTKDVSNVAYLIGRDKNIFYNNFEIIKTFLFKKNINIEENINENLINEKINSLKENMTGLVQEASYYIDGKELIITNGKDGVKIDEEKLKEEIINEIKDYSESSCIIEIPVIQTSPEKVDIEKIHNEIYKEAQDAYISQDPLTVHPNVDGVDFAISIEEAKKLLEENKDEYTIPLKITTANKTLSDLGKEAFPNTLGTFSTKYDVSNTNRSTNIKLATDKINGTIVMPGETFSYNKIVGKRTIESGYKEAGAYVGGQVVQEVGGGICQVSSTLYNAVLYSNLNVVERYNHCFESSYVDAGRDATVSWGTVDFKFKNDRKYPIKISATAKNGTETVIIYGIKEDGDYEVIVQSKKISTVNRTIKYVDDDTIESGKEVVTQTGHDGCVSETYKILRLNGKIVSTILVSKDTYNSLERIIKRGTKVEESTSTESEEVPIETNENKINIINDLNEKNSV